MMDGSHSSYQGGEQREAIRGRAGGAKGGDPGECRPAKHVPGTGPGKRVTGLDRIRQVARQRKKERFTSLHHHIDVDLLRIAFFALKRDAAAGVDGLMWKDYEADLERNNLKDLHARVQRGAYRHCRTGDSTYQRRTADSGDASSATPVGPDVLPTQL